MTHPIDNPAARLRAALDALGPNARYVRVEAIDLEAVLGGRDLLPFRVIGYTAEECERDMRRMTKGERGCPGCHQQTDTREYTSNGLERL